MKLSLCIATYNEEKFIHYPLDSAYDLVDEVIIVDGGSTDNTIEIVKRYGPKVRAIKTDNPPMFHINKQKAIEAARGEWILQLDADEALSEDLKSEIRSIVIASDPPVGGSRGNPDKVKSKFNGIASSQAPRNDINSKPVAYWLPRKNFFLSRFLTKGGVYPDYTIRLYKKGAAKFPCKSVHENVEIGTMKQLSNGAIGYLKFPILHYADPNFSRYLKRWHRYNNLDVDLLIKNHKKISFIQYLFIKPIVTFFNMFFRHKGFMDLWPGFIFAFFSSIRFWDIYLKWRRSR